MSTLMTDPVILPSSKITIDRQTIARLEFLCLFRAFLNIYDIYDKKKTYDYITNYILLIIFRHLLSDQTDPFNRSPLTMDMVKSNIELQHRVQEWIQQKKQEKMRNCH